MANGVMRMGMNGVDIGVASGAQIGTCLADFPDGTSCRNDALMEIDLHGGIKIRLCGVHAEAVRALIEEAFKTRRFIEEHTVTFDSVEGTWQINGMTV